MARFPILDRRTTDFRYSTRAVKQVPSQINAMKAAVDRTMGLDEPEMCVELQVFGHRRIGVKPQSRQIQPTRLGGGVIDQPPPQSEPLPCRLDRDVVDEIGVGF